MGETRGPASGLTSEEVARRRAAGLVNRVEARRSRSLADILAGNLFTRFNAIVGALVGVVLVLGHPIDALFGVVMVVNALIGIVQEVRAKVTLDRLRILVVPRVGVVRDGAVVIVPVEDVVVDDLVVIRSGDQVPADGFVVTSEGLQVDESLLTGEAEPQDKRSGDEVLSGSFVVAGSGTMVATAVGEAAYANRLAAAAREFIPARSELRVGIDRILGVVTWILLPVGGLLLGGQLRTDQTLSQAVVSAVAGVVGMIPQGLVLLVSMSFALAVVRLGARGALVQELPAVETLARVDTLCTDKTGTLTTGAMRLHAVQPLGRPEDEVRRALAVVVGADPSPNPTSRAIAAGLPAPAEARVGRIAPFSSSRGWSAVEAGSGDVWILGAPDALDVVLPVEVEERIRSDAAAGRRVLLLAHRDRFPTVEARPGGDAAAVVVLAEELRPDAAETVAWFQDQGVELKVVSGDDHLTVAAIASASGIRGARRAVDARRLGPPGTPGFVDAVERHVVFGRVAPEVKRALIEALGSRGRVVAMTGDGVNDVLALKRADLGIAMGSGSPATRAVAQVVLLTDSFSALPPVVAEGRRIVANMVRVAKLFLTKTVYAAVLALLIGAVGLAFPLLPRHLTLVGSATIGIPAFFLSFEPRDDPLSGRFLAEVFRFAVPAGLVTGVVTFVAYGLARLPTVGISLVGARSVATYTVLLLGWVVLLKLAPPTDAVRQRWYLAIATGVAAIVALPAGRRFFDLSLPGPVEVLTVGASVLLGFVLLEVGFRLTGGAGGTRRAR